MAVEGQFIIDFKTITHSIHRSENRVQSDENKTNKIYRKPKERLHFVQAGEDAAPAAAHANLLSTECIPWMRVLQ